MPITVYPTTEADITVPLRRKIKGSHSEGTEGLKTAFANLTYQVDWLDRWEFVRQINGIFPTGPQRLPMQYPDLPGILVSGTNNMRGLGIGTDCLAPYKYALLDVSFKTPAYETSGDNAYLKIDRDTGGEFITCPSGVYTFPDGTKSDVGIGEYVPLQARNITRFRIPSFNDAFYEDYGWCPRLIARRAG